MDRKTDIFAAKYDWCDNTKSLYAHPRSLFNFHNVGLSRIDTILQIPNAYQRKANKKLSQLSDIEAAFLAVAVSGVLWVIGIWLYWMGTRSVGLNSHALMAGGLLLWAITPIVSILFVYWLVHSENAAASFGASGVSAPTYGRAEDVWVVPVVVTELEFGDIQRKIFAARAFDEKAKWIVDSHDGANQIQHPHWYKGASHEWESLIPTICANVSLLRSKPAIPVWKLPSCTAWL